MPSQCLNEIAGVENKLIVSIGSLAVSNDPNDRLTTFSLGSCLGVAIYDPVVRAGGLLHAMLPSSSINPARAAERPAMFVDAGVAALFRACYELGADKRRLRICVAGGAHFMDKSNFFNIGLRNYQQFRDILRQHGLAIAAEEVGGWVSRTVQLNIRTGEVRLKTSGQNSETIL
jgi:chemotaxis protein CheD